MKATLYPSPLGVLTLISDGHSLTELHFAKQQEGREPQYLSQDQEPQVFADTRLWLDLYFGGEKLDFIPSLNPQGSLFQQKVWQALLTIPYGQTTTYGAIAKRLNCRSAQAVGQAIHRNPIAIIIPCHRVIGADGSLTGYAAGLDFKRELLKLENGLIPS